MKFYEVMIYFDYNMQNIARALKISRATVKKWKLQDNIPISFQRQLHMISKGKLNAEQCEQAEHMEIH